MDMKIKLELTVEEVNIILQGLGELPAKISMAVIQKIHSDVNVQMSTPKQPEN